MNHQLTFYTNPMSRGRIVRWMLEEVGASYHTEILEYGTSMKAAEYLTINPMGKVPAIKHGTTVVTECAAICAYLADAFPERALAPPLAERGDYYRGLFFAAGPVEAAITNRSLGFEVPEEQQRMAGYGSYGSVMDTLEKVLDGGDFITGKHFSAADVYVGSHVGWGLSFGTMEARPTFAKYWERVSDREAYRRATALDDGFMPKE